MEKAPKVPVAEKVLAAAPTEVPGRPGQKTAKKSPPPEVPPPLPIDFAQPTEVFLSSNLAQMSESSFDRHEIIDNAKHVKNAGMTSVKEVLAQHSRVSKPPQHKPINPPGAIPKTLLGQLSVYNLHLLLASPVYRRAIVTGAGGGLLVVAVLLFIQIY